MLAANVRRERIMEQVTGRRAVTRTRPRGGGRKADFLLLFLLGNGAGTGFLWWLEANTPTVLIVVSGMMFYTIALAWVMFVNHDDY